MAPPAKVNVKTEHCSPAVRAARTAVRRAVRTPRRGQQHKKPAALMVQFRGRLLGVTPVQRAKAGAATGRLSFTAVLNTAEYGTVHAKAFDAACELLHGQLEVHKMYTFKRARLEPVAVRDRCKYAARPDKLIVMHEETRIVELCGGDPLAAFALPTRAPYNAKDYDELLELAQGRGRFVVDVVAYYTPPCVKRPSRRAKASPGDSATAVAGTSSCGADPSVMLVADASSTKASDGAARLEETVDGLEHALRIGAGGQKGADCDANWVDVASFYMPLRSSDKADTRSRRTLSLSLPDVGGPMKRVELVLWDEQAAALQCPVDRRRTAAGETDPAAPRIVAVRNVEVLPEGNGIVLWSGSNTIIEWGDE